MRRITRSLVFAGAAFTLLALTPSASDALSFPATNTWQAMTRGGAVIVASAGGNGYEDIVGDAGNPAAFVYSDADFMYFRIRINADPGNNPPASTMIRGDRVYGCEIDTDGDAPFELIAAYDGADGVAGSGGKVSLRQSVGAASDSPSDVASNVISSNTPDAYPTSDFGRVSAVGSDYFVDFAVARAGLRNAGAGDAKPLRFACGTGFVSGSLNLQVFSPNDGTLSNVWSDPVVCGDSGCARDTDSDGVIDTVETALGTDPTKKDTDNDGIADNIELSASGTTGPYTSIDSDSDGTIDAKDSDSDNDCLPDLNEGAAGFRTKTDNPSSVCGVATMPVCKSTTGACSACDGDKGSGTPAACPNTTAPACQANGRCTECSATNTSLCINVATPACGPSATCQQCTGDKGEAGALAPCPSSAAPACQKTAGAIAGRCTACSATNVSLCTTAGEPACDTTTGSCSACNGDYDGGKTKACPTAAKPVCVLSGANQGTCGTCTTNADCGAGHNGPTCVGGACVDTDTDMDGLNDSVELVLGTDPTNADTDGDGIPDNIEVKPSGGGPNQRIDSDSDGKIDALDTDSDNDGVLDKDEGVADTDGDSAPDYRDPDDDGDQIPTAIELADALAAKVGDDADMDGKKNWLDDDANDNGQKDGVEGRGDVDTDGIPDYLDLVKDIVKTDAGTSTSSSGGTSPADGGFTSNDQDAGFVPDAGGPPEEGVVEGTGLFCGRATSGGSGDLGVFVLGVLAVIGIARRRR